MEPAESRNRRMRRRPQRRRLQRPAEAAAVAGYHSALPSSWLLPLLLLLLALTTAAVHAFVPTQPHTCPSRNAPRWPRRHAPTSGLLVGSREAAAPAALAAAASSSGSGSGQGQGQGEDEELLTREEIEACAADFGIELKLSTLGPFYRVVARLKGEAEGAEPMGYTEGFVAPPFGLVHLDTMQVRRRYWKQLQRDGARQFRFGCGVLLGAMAMRHAHDCGCRKAELLAIKDDERTHALLKAFYRTAGFVEVREVTQELRCVPDLLVWGGEGTRMDMQVEDFLRKWRPMIRSRGVEFKGGDG